MSQLIDLTFLLKGIVVGFVIAAPVGPIGILCAQRTLTIGRRAGFFSGMGAATADSFYGFVAAFGITIISDFLIGHQFWLQFIGGELLWVIGVRTFLTELKQEAGIPKTAKRFAGMYTSTFFLTLTNPATIFSFAAVFAGFGLAGASGSLHSAAMLILGVFLGSALWWLLIIILFSLFKKHIIVHELQWLNKLAGIIIAGTGVILVIALKW